MGLLALFRRKPSVAVPTPTLRETMKEEFPDISLNGVTDAELDSMAGEINAAMMAASFGDPRGYADLKQGIRIIIAEKGR